MTPNQQCKQAGLKGFWELIVLSDQPVSTLKNWNRTQNKGCTKFQLAIDAALYRRSEREEMNNVEKFLEVADELELSYPYLYVEIAKTRATNWMAWLCTHNREDNPSRKVICSGQGFTAEEACEDALKALENDK